ncbi:DUF192 domain-containing protein [Zwartia sp.]|uniref:DUF192 domain-containing protein n=1 Tax=Zwartia sp. TaxID=2978004 RepID=UPI003917F26D
MADSWFTRAGGLLMRPALKDQELLWLRPCRSIHTFGMRYPIAVFFIDCHLRVIDVIPNLSPNRIAFNRRAYSVVETIPIPQDQRLPSIAQLERVLSSEGGG